MPRTITELTAKQERFVAEYRVREARFWSYVDRSGGPDACWPWTGAVSAGYGAFHIGRGPNAQMRAHRVAFGLATGEVPEAVCHRCDNPPCCNPAHLFGGTRGDNNRDMAVKGRHGLKLNPERAARGERHGRAKLSETSVSEIRIRYAGGGITQRALAKAFGVCQRTIAKIVTGKGWRT